MRWCMAVFKVIRKGKYMLLLLLALSVLAWIVSSGSGTVQDEPRSSGTQSVVQDLVHRGEKNSKEAMFHSTSYPVTSSSPQPLCTLLSPLLQGAQKLSFPPALTLKEVEQENSKVVEGQYHPLDCIARQSVAILIPHRNREKHLLYLLHYLHPFLQRQQLHYGIYVIHQAGSLTFNRAKLLNVGYLEALKDHSWGCFIFHDVDLVPENDNNLYMCEEQPKHLVVGRNATGYKLRYKGYFGGVTAMTKEQFYKVNGFSNTYWGWGGEDDDLRIRVELQKMQILRPPPEVARYTMIFHKRDDGNEVNKDRMNLLRQTPRVWKKDGLNSCSYKMLSVERSRLFINITVEIGKPLRHP